MAIPRPSTLRILLAAAALALVVAGTAQLAGQRVAPQPSGCVTCHASLARHGDEDFTITTQQQMLDTLGSVLDVLTFAVAALGSISLLVGAVGIFTIMTIAVRERTSEIGLLRALGAERDQILALFLAEAVVLSLLGGLAGLCVGAGGAWVLGETVRQLPVSFSPPFIALALGLSVVIGLLAGILPAMNAARLDPVEALRAE